jgi:hypothetical protein
LIMSGARRKEILKRIVKKVPSQKSNIKITLIKFFDTKGTIHKEFVSEGSAVNSEKYLDALKRWLARITCVKSCLEKRRLLHDIASVYTAIMINVRTLLSKNWVAVLFHTL